MKNKRITDRSLMMLVSGVVLMVLFLLQPAAVQAQWTTPNASQNINNTNSGNVGIGTTSAAVKMQVTAPMGAGAVEVLGFEKEFGFGATGFYQYYNSSSDYGLQIGRSQGIQGLGNKYVTLNNYNGYLGIGTSSPSTKLHVDGDVTVTGNIAAKYQDVAEWVETSQVLTAATVVVLDSSKSNQVVAATQAYDTRVAGVISLKPGITLGEQGKGRVLVATTGRVKVKVDARNGPIQIGDLLVTSDKEGVAMKSVPVEIGGIRIHRPGTLIGKALEPLAHGIGEILVLLSLQ